MIKWSGLRSSGYGVRPFPSPAGWKTALNGMVSYFPGSTPVGVWVVGEVDFKTNGVALEFPRLGGSWDPLISFAEVDKHENYLDYFDAHGLHVFLQVESGFVVMHDLIDLVLSRYGHHPSVAGFGVDVEWYENAHDDGANAYVTDALAKVWEAQVKSYQSRYRLFLKHFDKKYLPPTYRGEIIFIDDSERNGDYDQFLINKTHFADFFYPNDVMFQIGYPSDKPWWNQLAPPIPQTIGHALAKQTRQDCGVIWVDFSLYDVFAEKLLGGC